MVNPDDSFYRITEGNVVRLKYSQPILITKVNKAADGTITVEATTEIPEGTNLKKIKATLNWVSQADAVDVETRLIGKMFDQEVIPFNNLEELRSSARSDSLVAMASKMNKNITQNLDKIDTYQFERQGFFSLDPESDLKKGKIILNRTLEQGA